MKNYNNNKDINIRHNQTYLSLVRTRFGYLKQKDRWTQAQKAQNNEFVENGLENWTVMSWTTSIIDSGDRKIKIN